MEFLRLIFSDWWIYFGFMALVSLIIGGALDLVKACKRSRRVTSYYIGKRRNVIIENATEADVQQALISAAYSAEEGESADGGE